MIAKSRQGEDHVEILRRLFDRLRKFKLRLNPAKCIFEAKSGKLLGFMVSNKGIEIDPSKVKAICDLKPPSTIKEVRNLLGRLNYVVRFISQLSETAKPFFKLLKKNAKVNWDEECQKSFEELKRYLSQSPVLVPPIQGVPLILYLTIHEESLGAILAQKGPRDGIECAIYYLSKKFTTSEIRYPKVEKTCVALIWVLHRLRQYTLHHRILLVTENDLIKYLLEKPALVGRLTKWQILLFEFDIQSMAQKSIKGRAIADMLAENPGKSNDWAVLISPEGQYYPVAAKLVVPCTNNISEYEACIIGLQLAIDMKVRKLQVYGDSALIILQTEGEWQTRDVKLIPYHEYLEDLVKEFDEISFDYLLRSQNQFADALATLSSMLQVTDGLSVNPLQIDVLKKPAYCLMIEEEPDGQPWYYDIMNYLREAIDYFTKWIEANSYAHVTAKSVAKFIRRDIIAQYGVPEVIITDNRSNLNNKMVDDLLGEFNIRHLNSSPYRPQMNEAVEAFVLRPGNTVLIGLRDGSQIPVEVEIPSLRVLPIIPDPHGKFTSNYEGPYIVKKVLLGGALILVEIDGEELSRPVNADVVKKYYP
ncbi:uncharacterized protein LOC120287353 [Eucalyptus grandis]|uniref:uncharacterized protein LOC120287353 n=1 Tax=Eucalyptus grandis TaxID=71139 RepID=UPI00192F090C|nr:uncharacterized protein LOC120287353 [Eucalyptus grandis]